MSITLSGKISFTPVVDVLDQLLQRKATGTLSVSSGDVKKCIFFKIGQIVFATSTSSEDWLGEILVKTGRLKRGDLEYATRLYKKSAGLKKLGAILVENGLIASKDLFGGLKSQVKEILFSLVLLTEGDYQFEDSFPSDIILLQFNFQDLITEIIQRIKKEA
jgi:hypothetical protein